jgi:hypothetical protein
MTREEQDRMARSRFATISASRAAGVCMMLLGMWIWWGDGVREGGYTPVGFPLFALGFFVSLILPQLLARRWRTPPAP